MSFPASAPAAWPVFLRSYSRRLPSGLRESFEQVIERNLSGLVKLGKLSKEEAALLRRHQEQLTSLPSGRWLWVGGTPWLEDQRNFSGAYNCTSTIIDSPNSLSLLMDLAMMGSGTGAVLEERNVSLLPPIANQLRVMIVQPIGACPPDARNPATICTQFPDSTMKIKVGDSRQGWVTSFQLLIDIAMDPLLPRDTTIEVMIDLSHVRPAGERLNGFGGVANPTELPNMYIRMAKTLNRAFGRRLTPLECCLLIDEGARTVVAGNIRRSAGMRQFSEHDSSASSAKDNLWQQGEDGHWSIDPERDALRMANHTWVFHHKPSYEEVLESVTKQHRSGEGAIQFAPEAIARGNADLLPSDTHRCDFLTAYCSDESEAKTNAQFVLQQNATHSIPRDEMFHRMNRYGLNPCGEIEGANLHCNLAEIHLNLISPSDAIAIQGAFKAAAVSVCALLHHRFRVPRYQQSREWDPIVGVSFTGLFDHFAVRFGSTWLEWWKQGRPPGKLAKLFRPQEAHQLRFFRNIVKTEVEAYCQRHGLKAPNRYTTVQPAGCLDRTALRVFDQGLIYADEVMAPGSGESKATGLTVRSGISANTGIANQPIPLVRVTLRNGRILRMTPDHRLRVLGTGRDWGSLLWCRADCLREGMQIDHKLGQYDSAGEAPLLPADASTYTREHRQEVHGHGRGVLTAQVTTPDTMSPDLAYFLGAMFGNGSTSASKFRVRFSMPRNSLVTKRLQLIGRHLFDLPGSLSVEERREELSFASGQLYDWLHLNSLVRPKSLELERIPLAVRRSSRESVLSFIAGLIDTDGCVRERGHFSIDLAAEKFIRNLQQVGEAVGIAFKVSHNTQGKNLQGVKNMWTALQTKGSTTAYARDYLNKHSVKCLARPLQASKRGQLGDPFTVLSVERDLAPDYSYDFAIDGRDDDDSWYYQGAIVSHNTKSLLTGASPGWHPPKAIRFIRRITFAKNDPIALACIDYGYTVVPSQSDKDEQGHLLCDPFDPRCTEWLVEIPVEVPWAQEADRAGIDPNEFSALAQFDFYMQVQRYYTTHNSSATIELREDEIEPLAYAIHKAIQDDRGYVSAALLARMDCHESFPRMPYEPVDRATYDRLHADVLARRKTEDFMTALAKHDGTGDLLESQGPAGCDSEACLLPLAPPPASV